MRYPNAAKGLQLMFTGQILFILAIVLGWVPLVGFLLAVAAPVLELMGIYKAGDDDENYRGALVFAVLALVINLVSGAMQPGFLSSLLNMASNIVGLLLMFAVCNTTCNLLHSIGQEALVQRGGTVIKIYTACTVVSIVCQVLGIIPIINIIAGLMSIAAALVQLVGYVMYLLFLNGSSKAL